jgi:branched-chain amino acid transport system substrate-binding protein
MVMAQLVRTTLLLCLAVLASAPTIAADKNNAPGVTDTEIKIGQTMPYSGPASAFGTIGRAEVAYFAMVNDQGGINGRKINLISLDDGYSPPKALEQTRDLIERYKVAFIFGSLGTPSNVAIRKYLNDQGVPQLFVATGAAKFDDPKHFRWTMAWPPNFRTEGMILTRYVLSVNPSPKIGLLYQNDDIGADHIQALRDSLGDRFEKTVVRMASYEVGDPTIEPQVVQLQGSGADVFYIVATPKYAAQAIRKAATIGWKPLRVISYPGTSVEAVLRPAGLENAKGIVGSVYLKDPTDPQWRDEPAVHAWQAWMAKYYPSGNAADGQNVYAYLEAQTLVETLKQCGDDLSRENIMRQAANLHGVTLDLMLPGMSINTSPDDYRPLKQMQLARFDGKNWKLFGDLITAEK